MTFLHNVYFHAWHFAFQQIQLNNWMGNIVAGIVVYLLARDRYKKFHAKLNEPLHEKLELAHKLMRHVIEHHPDIPEMEE